MNGDWKPLLMSAALAAIVSAGGVFAALHWSGASAESDSRIHAYLLEHPEIMIEMQSALQRQADARAEREQQEALDKVGIKALFDPRVAFVTGPANARKSVVEFFDYNCGHCRNSFPAVKKFYQAHKADTRFAFIELPIFGQASVDAARSSLASRNQADKFVAFHFALMGQQGAIDPSNTVEAAKAAGLNVNKLMADLKDPAINSDLVAARALAERIKLNGTPLFVVNGKVHSGEITLAELEQLTRS